MKIMFGKVEGLSARYESWDALFQAYVADTVPPSEVPARYSFETIALLIGGWLLSKAADLVVDELVDVVKQRQKEEKDDQDKGRDRAGTAKVVELRPGLPPDGADASMIVMWAKANRIPITIILETPAERDLESSLYEIVGSEPNTIVYSDKQ